MYLKPAELLLTKRLSVLDVSFPASVAVTLCFSLARPWKALFYLLSFFFLFSLSLSSTLSPFLLPVTSDSFCGPVSVAQHLSHQAPFPSEPSTVAGLFRGRVLTRKAAIRRRLPRKNSKRADAQAQRFGTFHIRCVYYSDCSSFLCLSSLLKGTRRHRLFLSSRRGDSRWTLSPFLERKLPAATA